MINRNINGTDYCITNTERLVLPEDHPFIEKVPVQYRGIKLTISDGYSLGNRKESVLIIEGKGVETVVRKQSEIFKP